MSNENRVVPDWLLEKLRRGELPPRQADELRLKLEAAGQLGRLTDLETSDAEILAAHPPAQVIAEVRRRSTAAAPRARVRVWPLFPVLAAAALWLYVSPRPVDTIVDEQITAKGRAQQPSLRLYRKTAGGHEVLGPETRVRPGDTLQVRYLAAEHRYGVIASIDARGAVTVHLPEAGDAAASLRRGDERALPHAFQLDDAPGFERFLFMTSDRPFGTADAIRFLEGAGAPGPGLSTWEITLKKETP